MKQLRGVELKRFNRKNKKTIKEVYLLLENIQYATNVASMFRIAEAFGVKKIFLTGITHKPPFGKQLQKTSRKKEEKIPWEYYENSAKVINNLKNKEFQIVGLEITDKSVLLKNFKFADKVLLIAGNEAYGIVKNTLEKVDNSVYIPMQGKGASLNVTNATAISLYKIIE